jgi:hypothetical protein
MDDLVFWFEDQRPWPEDLKGEEVAAICDAIERHANAELDVRLEQWRNERAVEAGGGAADPEQ